MASVREYVHEGQVLTAGQRKELESLENRPVLYDDDCPKLTSAQLAEVERIAKKQQEEKKRITLSLRVSREAVEKARSLEADEGFLGKLLELALDRPELVSRCR